MPFIPDQVANIMILLAQRMSHLELLLMPFQDVVLGIHTAVLLSQTLNYFILRWQVNLVQDLAQFAFEFAHFNFLIPNLQVFLFNEEPQILLLILQLSHSGLPFEFHLLNFFLIVNHVNMQLVILLAESFIFLLQRSHCLLVQLIFIQRNLELVLCLLKVISCFQEVVKKFFS